MSKLSAASAIGTWCTSGAVDAIDPGSRATPSPSRTNSITLAGGESLDVILDATGYTAGQTFYLYTPNLDHLSNDAENFGGLMTEVRIN